LRKENARAVSGKYADKRRAKVTIWNCCFL
jgi:hypothetical protein